MKDENWDDLRLFLHVAREGGLAGAAEKTGLSAPTIGRRMLALERTTGRSLFVRTKTGYALAPDGTALLERVKQMQAAAQSISDWRVEVLTMPIVRVIADSFLMRLLANRLADLWTPRDPFRMCLKTCDEEIDLTYREADIAIMPARPKTGNVAARRIAAASYAPYRARHFDGDRHCNWVSLGTDVARHAWERWTFEQPDRWITTWVCARSSYFDLVRGGAGRGLLPDFLAEGDPALVRDGPPIAELNQDLWIVLHDEERGRAEVRLVADRLAAILARRAAAAA